MAFNKSFHSLSPRKRLILASLSATFAIFGLYVADKLEEKYPIKQPEYIPKKLPNLEVKKQVEDKLIKIDDVMKNTEV